MGEITRQKLSRIFDMIWKEADKILAEWNPCQINKEMGTCMAGCYYACRNNAGFKNLIEFDKYVRDNSFCCNGCPHLGPEGCTVQALSCRLWLCDAARKYNPTAFEKLTILRRHMDKWCLGSFRAPKKAAINYAMNVLNNKSNNWVLTGIKNPE